MHRLFPRLLVPIAVCLSYVGVSQSGGSSAGAIDAASSKPMCGATASMHKIRHVIVIVDENKSYGEVVGSQSAPYINSIVAKCAVATNFHNLTHPSLPNYLGLTFGGSLSRIDQYSSDCQPSSCPRLVGSNNLFHEIPGRKWMSYEESMPYSCDRSDSGGYAAKHNPAVYYTDLNGACATHDVALGSPSQSPLLTALSSEATAPALSFVTPNLCDDMHDCSVGTGDSWLQTWLPLITSSTVYGRGDTAVFVVWDEGDGDNTGESCAWNVQDQSCHVPLLVIAPSVHRGTAVRTQYNDYSLLKTIEVLLGVPQLGGAKSARSMTSAFHV